MKSPEWLHWTQRLQAIAQNGLTYAENAFDRERYEQIRAIASEMAAAYTHTQPEVIHDLYTQESGYATPKVDVRGVVFREDKLLLVREASDGLWTLPGGWADVGDTPAQAVEREIREESGFEARAVKLLAAYDRTTQGHPPYVYAVYKLFFLCELTGGAPTTSNETTAVSFFSPDALPPLSTDRVTAAQIARFVKHLRQPDLQTDFD